MTKKPKTTQDLQRTIDLAKAIMDKLYTNLSKEDFTKADIMRYLKTNIAINSDSVIDMTDVFGEITEDMIDEIEENNLYETDNSMSGSIVTNLTNHGQFQTLDISKMTAKQKKSFVEIPTMEEARFLEDIYYQTQEKRIVIENQLRSLNQEADSEIPTDDGSKNRSFLEWYLYNMCTMEDEVKKALAVFSDSCYIARWAKANIGIGPVIATCLASNLRIFKDENGLTDMHAGNWWSFCGLNDRNRPWLGIKKSTAIVEESIIENGGVIDDNLIYILCDKTQWKYEHYEKMARNENGTWSKDKLIKASAIIPYKKSMKVLCYKIGHSFMLCKNKSDSLYGRLLKEREALENHRNNKGLYADQAAKILEEKNIGKSTKAYQFYSQGMLPPAHISARCRRYVTKLFISHLFEAAYYNEYGTQAPQPYVLSFIDGHADYIGPEVPYDSIPRDCEK